MHSFIAAGSAATDLARTLESECRRAGIEPLSADRVDWLPPIEAPVNFLCAGRNFTSHQQESRTLWQQEGLRLDKVDLPTGFVKLASALTGHCAIVQIPPGVTQLDYEVEVAMVIGKPTALMEIDNPLDCAFGYTIFNDLCDRQLQRREMRNQLLLAAKNFPGYGPLGPWIVTADEVPNPSLMHMELRVNGELRQSASIGEMTFSFEDLLRFWGRLHLEPGDLIASGTPSGVAVGHAESAAWFLKSGDRIEASVEPLGTLTTFIA